MYMHIQPLLEILVQLLMILFCLCIIFIYTYNECQVCCGLHHFHLMVCSHFWCAGDYISLQHQYEVDMASAPHRGDTLF